MRLRIGTDGAEPPEMSARSWLDDEVLPEGSPYGLGVLPVGVFSLGGEGAARRLGVRVGDAVLDVAAAARAVGGGAGDALLEQPVWNAFLAAGPEVWARFRADVTGWLTDPAHERAVRPHLHPLGDAGVRLHLPFEVADYVDFYASEHHAANIGRLLRPGSPPLTPNWKHLPIGYHGRAGTVVASGTPVRRPCGQRRENPEAAPEFGPSVRLDFEAEVGFVVGPPSVLGTPVPLDGFERHVFGVVLVNDWSARDIQAWEYVPLGPFLGKSFATSVSPWITPLAALGGARIAPPRREPVPLAYLDDRGDGQPWGLDLRLEVRLNGTTVSRPEYAAMYWTPAQMLAHLTANGASLRTGDMFASGTVSGAEPGTEGSLMELSANGTRAVRLADGTERGFLADGDEVRISAYACGGLRVPLGEVVGRVLPAVEGFA